LQIPSARTHSSEAQVELGNCQGTGLLGAADTLSDMSHHYQRKPKGEPLDNHPKYDKVRDINSGTFGFVQLARDRRTGELVAVKFIERGEKISRYVEREILNHRCLHHPHIIRFREVFMTPDYLAIAMEFAAGGDMFEYVVKKNGLREDEARWFFQQLIVGMDYCHNMGVVNRDIKLENTLLDASPKPLLKICDFGYSKHELMHSQPKSKVGTPGYIAPEVILNKHYDGKIADIWSCGVMLYVMLVGAYPFERQEDKGNPQKLQAMITRILKVEYTIPSYVKISDECRDMMQKILVAEPEKRITVDGIKRHPWFLKDLPPGVAEMNNHLPNVDADLQPVEDIERIVRECQQSGYSGQAIAGTGSADDLIDDAMENVGFDSGRMGDEWGRSG